MADCKKYNGSTWQHSLRKLSTDTDTITTLPAELYPTGTTATVGLKGQAVQSTTPTPDNPIMPQGTGERTANLWDRDVPQYAYGKDYKKYNPDNAIALKAGTYTISSDGILPQIQAFHADLSPYADIQDVIQKDANMSVGWGNRALLPTANTLRCTTIVIAEDCIITLCCNPTYIGTYIMLNIGSTALPYEPYGYKLTITSATTTTPVYLGEVQTTRRVKKLVLTGKETVSGDIGYNRFIFTIPDMRSEGVRLTKLFCTHYQNISDGRPIANVPNNSIYTGGGADSQKVFIKTTDYTTVADFNSYLAQQYSNGTPVTIWYVLATEETAVVNEPLMRIGDYADEVSNISIPVTAGGDTLSVDTTVQPSEITVNYKGWHPAIVHERTNGAWT